jgi:tetratricopeptide (TPR) repeat protein
MAAKSTRKRKGNRFPIDKVLVTEIVVLILLVAGLIGGVSGYRTGAMMASQVKGAVDQNYLQDLFQLGVEDFESDRFELARQRFEFVQKIAPNEFPETQAYLAQILAVLNATATFTPVSPTSTIAPTITPTLTPTIDRSGEESIYQRAQLLLEVGDWDGSIAAFLALRNIDLYYRVVEVDDALYVALRNRGENKILYQGNLEGGIYDLALAEEFGPLDYRGSVYRDWARLYLTALGFWQAYPQQAVYYFGQIAASAPGLKDGGGWTALERYRASLIHNGAALEKTELWCVAQVQYETALSIRFEAELSQILMRVTNKCSPPTKTPTPTIQITTTITTTATVSPVVTLTPTLTPSLTPTPPFTVTNTIIPSPTETIVILPTETFTPGVPPTETFTSMPPTETSTPVASPTETTEPYP